MADAEAIIIGSGHNALCAALYLADAGWRVVVLERGAEVGGGMRTDSLTGAGYQHDLYATNIGAFVLSPVYRDYGAALAEAGLVLLKHDRPFASAFDGGSALPVYCDQTQTAAEIGAVSASDRAMWLNACHLFARLAPRILPLMQRPMPSMSAACQLLKLAAKPIDVIRASRLAIQPCGPWTERLFEAPTVRALLTPWAFHTDYGPNDRGGAMFAFIAAFSAARHGLISPRGGAGSLTAALLKLLAARGVVVKNNASVVRIETCDGSATGVRTAAGEKIEASRAIVAGVSPSVLVNGLLAPDEMPASAIRLRSFAFGPGTFVLHLALRRALRWRARDDLAGFFYVHLNGEAERIAKTIRQTRQGMLPDRPMIVVSQPTVLDPSRAPPGHHIVRLHVRCVPREIVGDAGGKIVARDWSAAKEPFTQRLLSILESHAPNVRDDLSGYVSMSPADIEKDNPNMQAGDCSGGSHQLRQHYMFRPALGWSKHRTPIRHLYLTGAGTWPGAGIHGQSGYLAARQVLAQAQPSAAN